MPYQLQYQEKLNFAEWDPNDQRRRWKTLDYSECFKFKQPFESSAVGNQAFEKISNLTL